MIKLILHWPRFGPYHLARLEKAAFRLRESAIQVIGLEIAVHDEIYSWHVGDQTKQIEYRVAFPDRYIEELSFIQIYRRVGALLRDIKPDVVAINGYSAVDSLAILLWCRINGCPAILMSDSKADDFPRHPLREAFKRWLVSQYSAGFCAGSLHRDYLVWLGMNPGRIRLGYDVVDNEFFERGAEAVRRMPAQVRHLPGLGSPERFFLVSARWIERKNIHGVLSAYHQYRHRIGRLGCDPWRLVVLGDGPQKDKINQFVSEHQIAGVEFPGFRQAAELPAYYGRASVFIHIPIQEQWGLVVNEAMASGLPVLVSKQCGCAPELVVDGRNGFLVDAHDLSPLVKHMIGFTTGAYDAAAMGAASREIIQHWGLERFAGSLLELTRLCTG